MSDCLSSSQSQEEEYLWMAVAKVLWSVMPQCILKIWGYKMAMLYMKFRTTTIYPSYKMRGWSSGLTLQICLKKTFLSSLQCSIIWKMLQLSKPNLKTKLISILSLIWMRPFMKKKDMLLIISNILGSTLSRPKATWLFIMKSHIWVWMLNLKAYDFIMELE